MKDFAVLVTLNFTLSYKKCSIISIQLKLQLLASKSKKFLDETETKMHTILENIKDNIQLLELEIYKLF